MEAHITVHDSQGDAAAKAGEMRDAGFQVALAGLVGDTFFRPGPDGADMVITGERWIVLATDGGLILID